MIVMALRGGVSQKFTSQDLGKCDLTITPPPPEFSKVGERRIYRKKLVGEDPLDPLLLSLTKNEAIRNAYLA